MRNILGTIALAALVGCAQFTWVKDGADAADFERDKAQCVYEASLATAGAGSGSGYYRSTGQAVAAGIGEGIALGLRQLELATLCMRARGYQQVPIAQ